MNKKYINKNYKLTKLQCVKNFTNKAIKRLIITILNRK